MKQGSQFPNMVFQSTDGATLHAWDLYQKHHGLYLFVDNPSSETLALASRFQEKEKLFTWLKTRLLPVFSAVEKVPTPWPAPGYQPWLYAGHLPDGMEWGKAYLVSRFRSVFEIYDEPEFLSAAKIEEDVTYYEANHC